MGERSVMDPVDVLRHGTRAPASLRVIVCLFLAISAAWTFGVPVRDAQGIPSSFHPDEPNHIAVIAYIAERGALPPYIFDYYESAHPPLYHLAAAGVYYAAEPILGYDGSVRLLRLIGGVLGAALVWLVWQTALPLIGKQGAFLSAVLAAGIPMFVSLSASVTNETLAALSGAGALAGLTAGIRNRHFDRRTLTTVGLWTAIGVGTKVTCLGLLMVSLGIVCIVGYRRLTLPHLAAQLGLIVFMTAIFSGWWYARNAVLYGDPLRRAEAAAMWQERIPGYTALSAEGRTTVPRYVARVTFWGWAGFWGVFDAFRRPLPTWIYAGIASFQILALCGLLRSLRRSGLRRNTLWPLIAVAAPFAAAVAIVYYRYTWDHYTPQGRFFFPVLLPFAILTAAGWLSLWTSTEKEIDASAIPQKVVTPLAVSLVLLNAFTLLRTLTERAG